MRFEELSLIDPLLRAVKDEGYTEPTPIQEQAIPHVMKGRDLIGLAQTGTGKTASFALPILQRLQERAPSSKRKKRPFLKVLVLAPTRELASQIGDSFKTYGRYLSFDHVTIYGGVSQNRQVNRLQQGVSIVIATPGRLLDLMNQGLIDFSKLEMLVLDEADRMFDMGFLPDLKRIIAKLPEKRQTLLFSATMPPDIQALAQNILTNPVEVAIAPESTVVEAIEQQVYFVEKADKRKLLKHLLNENNMYRTLVFTRTKHGANRLSQQLTKAKINSAAIHGDKSQRARQTALDSFKNGKVQVLIATDVVARGIDVDDISHVINFDLPNETETYVHRIGRTGRAGTSGVALSFCAADERDYLVNIERLIQMHIPVTAEHPYSSEHGVPKPTQLDKTRRSSNGSAKKNGASSNKKRSGGSRNRRRKSQKQKTHQ